MTNNPLLFSVLEESSRYATIAHMLRLALVLVLLYALGWYTPVYRVFYAVMPGAEYFRRPADATFVLGLLLAIVCGYCVHCWIDDRAAPSTTRQRVAGIAMASILLLLPVMLAVKVGALATAALPIGIAIVAATAHPWARKCLLRCLGSARGCGDIGACEAAAGRTVRRARLRKRYVASRDGSCRKLRKLFDSAQLIVKRAPHGVRVFSRRGRQPVHLLRQTGLLRRNLGGRTARALAHLV